MSDEMTRIQEALDWVCASRRIPKHMKATIVVSLKSQMREATASDRENRKGTKWTEDDHQALRDMLGDRRAKNDTEACRNLEDAVKAMRRKRRAVQNKIIELGLRSAIEVPRYDNWQDRVDGLTTYARSFLLGRDHA